MTTDTLDDNPLAADHEYDIVRSDTPVSEDGYKIGEPKAIECHYCDAAVILTEEKTPGVWQLTHEPWCPDVE
ncbi:hypothetical protein OSG_eHP14_00100 [environmental Halophage eHP-14]|nr:hypothetical protein OSG_eHP14_00100 [environmental Halophage eHP-14]